MRKERLAWRDMHRRCGNSLHRQFKNYGGRGITVCRRWSRFENFLADMGEAPIGHRVSLERKDNNKGYSPSNCVWATQHEQRRNDRRTRRITVGGETLCMKDWAVRYGINYDMLKYRIWRGWDPVFALTTPRYAHYSPRRA